MAKISERNIYRTGKSGVTLNFKTFITVDSKGIFYMTIPDTLAPVAQGLGIFSAPHRNQYRISSKTLKEVEKDLDKIINEFITCDKSSELVIIYDYVTKCHYIKNSQGKIFPNGKYAPEDYEWIGESHSFEQEDYVVGVRAKVMAKVTHKSESNERIEYEGPRDTLGEFGEKLNDFTRVSIRLKQPKELPYTEGTAQLFYDAMLGLCTLAERLDCALSEPKKILAASSLLLPEKQNLKNS